MTQAVDKGCNTSQWTVFVCLFVSDIPPVNTFQVPSPVDGMVTSSGHNAIRITPVTSGFTDYEIFISNIVVDVAIADNGTFVEAGQVRSMVIIEKTKTEILAFLRLTLGVKNQVSVSHETPYF